MSILRTGRDQPLGHVQKGRAPDVLHLDVLGQQNGELFLRDGHDAAVRAVHERDGRAPVALARDEPVAQAEVHLALAEPLALAPGDHRGDGPGRRQAVELARVAGDTFFQGDIK